MVGALVRFVSVHHHGVTFSFDSAKATNYYMYTYIIVLFPLTAILQLINLTVL